MKSILLFSFLSFSFCVNSQDWEALLPNYFNFENDDKSIPQAQKKEAITKLQSIGIFKELYDYKGSLEIDNFHFFNLDDDEHLEIIFYGFAGAESNITVLIDNKNGELRILDQFMGRIVSIDKNNSNQLSKIKILEFACCAGVVNHLLTYSWSPIYSEYQVIDDIAFIDGTEWPLNFSLRQRFKTTAEYYRLRSSPIIDNSKYSNNERDFDAIGNILAEFPEGTEGTALAEKTDETGRVWWFVYFDPISRPSNSLFHGSSNYEGLFKFAGWTSSRYVEKIDH